MEKKFYKPSISTQFTICSVPYRCDSYCGCVFQCSYCFAMLSVSFCRRNKPDNEKNFNHLIGNRVDLFEKWLDKTMAKKEYDYNKAEEVALLERIPLKIGTNADPFPPIEKTEKITYGMLKALMKYDYPTELQTKNPMGFVDIAKDFIGANITIAVTLISVDEEFSKIIEPYAPSPKERLKAIKILTDMGFNVMIKIQPAIYPKIIDELPDIIEQSSTAGAWGFNIEGLKCKISMPKPLQLEFQKIGDSLNMDIREFYREERKSKCNRGSDYELSNDKKDEIFKIANTLSKKYNMKFFNADNYMNKEYGNGCECCGTEKLRNYKLFPHDKRSEIYGNNKGSLEIGKCKCNFLRDRTGLKKYKTLKEICDEYKHKNS